MSKYENCVHSLSHKNDVYNWEAQQLLTIYFPVKSNISAGQLDVQFFNTVLSFHTHIP